VSPPKKKRRATQTVETTVVHPNAAGIDVGAKAHYIAVPTDRTDQPVRCFGTTTVDLIELSKWLLACGVDTVAIESTGVYWIPLAEILEVHGIEVCLVNARHIQNVPGRKTDVSDCQWLRDLHTVGLLRASFRPTLQICELRAYVRQREDLVARQTTAVHHIQKALTLMNLRLDTVLSNVVGVSGMAIVRDILSGQRDPKVLAAHRQSGCKASEEQIAAALTGNYRDEHVFALRQAVESYDFIQCQMRDCDAQIERVLNRLVEDTVQSTKPAPAEPPAANKSSRRKPDGNEPAFDLAPLLRSMTGCDLSLIDGLGPYSALKIISEIGHDMERWRTAKHFTSWLHLCPGNNITGGKRRPCKKDPAASHIAQHFRVAAMAAGRSDSALGAFYRRLAYRIGPAKAIVATARKIAILVYNALRYGMRYVDDGAAAYSARFKDRLLRSMSRRAAALGYRLVPRQDAAACA
jgi:transposase